MIYLPSDDSFLLAEQVKLFSNKKTVLDIGTGSGIQALTALKNGAKKVIASDINSESFKEVRKHGITCIKSDLFSNIKGKFDLIIFNPPYLPEEEKEDSESKLITTGGKRGDEILLDFFKQASSHLSEKGIILIVLSSLTPKSKLLSLLKEKKLVYKKISQKNLFMEKLEVWKISRKL